MFKYLTKRDQDPGFDNAVVLANRSPHWLELDAEGRRLPPNSYAAMHASLVAQSTHLSGHIESGLVVVVVGDATQPARSKRKRKGADGGHEKAAIDSAPAVSEEAPTQVAVDEVQGEHKPDEEPEVQLDTTLVADTEPENWVSSTENIVGEPTPDQI